MQTKKTAEKDIQYLIHLQNYSTNYSLDSKTVLHAQRRLKISNKTVFDRANLCKLFSSVKANCKNRFRLLIN